MELKISLFKVLEILENENLVKEKNIEDRDIKYISFDSRDIKENTLFFCKGANYKEEYLTASINNRSCLLYI